MRSLPALSLLFLVACAAEPVAPVAPTPVAPPSASATPAPAPAPPSPGAALWHYPPTPTSDAADTYFGKTYKDPFRPLEDLKAPDTVAWFKAQATLTDGLLDKIPGRDALVAEWTALDKRQPATYGSFSFEGGRLFYKKTLGGESVGKLYMRQGWTGPEQLLFDPSAYTSPLSAAGKTTTLESYAASWDGKRVAIGFSSGGAEYSEVRVLDVAKKALLPDSLYPCRFGVSWTPDSKAIFYDAGKVTDITAPDIQLNRMVRLHTIGTATSTDVEVLGSDGNPELGLQPKEIPFASAERHAPGVLLGIAATVQNEFKAYTAAVSDLGHKVKWTPLALPSDAIVRGLVLCGPDAVCGITYVGAPHYKIVKTSLRHPDWAHAETLVPEAADSIQYMARTRSFLFVVYSNGILGRIVKLDLATKKTSEVKLPVTGDVDITCPDPRGNRCLVGVNQWTQPRVLFELDGDKNVLQKSVFNSDVTYPGFDSLVAEEVEVPGHDGTQVPLSIIHKKDLPMDGSSPCILEGYGAYGISYTPFFSPLRSVALHGVVVAYAHPRGGSEKGEAWYRAGFKTTKPNTWKDFISTAEYLVQKGYTSKERLAGTGTSAGGILISRAITERPELFAAAVCNVGVANALRTEFSPNGPINTPEFGTVADPVEAAALYEMDGVQHVQPGVRYPAVLGVGGWNDPRVSPWETGKFIAALQAASASDKPVLMKVNYDNGHFTEDKDVTFRNFASQYAFMLWQTGHKEFQPAAAPPR